MVNGFYVTRTTRQWYKAKEFWYQWWPLYRDFAVLKKKWKWLSREFDESINLNYIEYPLRILTNIVLVYLYL